MLFLNQKVDVQMPDENGDITLKLPVQIVGDIKKWFWARHPKRSERNIKSKEAVLEALEVISSEFNQINPGTNEKAALV